MHFELGAAVVGVTAIGAAVVDGDVLDFGTAVVAGIVDGVAVVDGAAVEAVVDSLGAAVVVVFFTDSSRESGFEVEPESRWCIA